jgi:hypothetical protein
LFTVNTAGEAPTVRILLEMRNNETTVQTKRGKQNRQREGPERELELSQRGSTRKGKLIFLNHKIYGLVD